MSVAGGATMIRTATIAHQQHACVNARKNQGAPSWSWSIREMAGHRLAKMVADGAG
jgi:hypothetical protein